MKKLLILGMLMGVSAMADFYPNGGGGYDPNAGQQGTFTCENGYEGKGTMVQSTDYANENHLRCKWTANQDELTCVVLPINQQQRKYKKNPFQGWVFLY